MSSSTLVDNNSSDHHHHQHHYHYIDDDDEDLVDSDLMLTRDDQQREQEQEQEQHQGDMSTFNAKNENNNENNNDTKVITLVRKKRAKQRGKRSKANRSKNDDNNFSHHHHHHHHHHQLCANDLKQIDQQYTEKEQLEQLQLIQQTEQNFQIETKNETKNDENLQQENAHKEPNEHNEHDDVPQEYEEEDNDDSVRLNEICILHVTIAKFNRKFLSKYFTKNYGKVIRTNLYMEDSAKASVLVRFQDASVAQSIVQVGEICFAPLEKNPVYHKVKQMKVVKRAPTKKKKKKKKPNKKVQKCDDKDNDNDQDDDDDPLLKVENRDESSNECSTVVTVDDHDSMIHSDDNGNEHQTMNDSEDMSSNNELNGGADDVQSTSSDCPIVTISHAPNVPYTLSPHVCSETSSITDDCSSISTMSYEPGGNSGGGMGGNGANGADPINIKKKKKKRKNKNAVKTELSDGGADMMSVPWQRVMTNISVHRKEILYLALSYSPDQHEQMAGDLAHLLLGGDESSELVMSKMRKAVPGRKSRTVEDEQIEREKLFNRLSSLRAMSQMMEKSVEEKHSVLYEEFTIFNFVLFMNIMANPGTTFIILQECERLKTKIEQMCNLPSIDPPKKVTLALKSQNSITTFTDTSQYCLRHEIENLIQDILPTQQEKYHNRSFIKMIEKACRQAFTNLNHKVSPYGSSANGFSMRGSDIDLALNFDESVQIDDVSTVLTKLKKQLLSDGIHSARIIGHRLPILKVHYFNVECDICVNNYFAVVNTLYLLTFSKLDKMLQEVVHMIKYWAKNVGINESAQGTLSSYSYVLMIIFYFQNIGRLPSLHKLLHHPSVNKADIANPNPVLGMDCRYVSNVATVKRIMNRNMIRDRVTGAELVIGFFMFYAQFDFSKYSVCVKSGAPIEKKTWSKDYHISIVDPFEHQRDLGSVIASKRKAETIIKELCEASHILSSGGVMKDVIEDSIARQFAEAAKQADKGGTFRRYPSQQVMKKLQDNKTFASGVLSVESLDPVRAFVKVDTTGDMMRISTIGALNRALHSDHVFIKKTTSTDCQVVSILKKNSPTVFACVAEVHSNYVWMRPIDVRYPKMITTTLFLAKTVGCKQSQALKFNGFVFACQMQPWEYNERYPQIHSLEVLGSPWDPLIGNRFLITNETQFVSTENTNPPTHAIGLSQAYRDEMRPGAVDRLQQPIFSIVTNDRSTIAFNVEESDNDGNIQLHVYLPDVYSYCANDVNIEMNGRLFGINLGHSTLPIVDSKLSSLCSLDAGQEKNAICVQWKVNKQTYDVSDCDILFARIKPRVSLQMREVQDMLEGTPLCLQSEQYAPFQAMIHSMRQVVRSFFPLTRSMNHFRFVFSSFTGIPFDIVSCRDAQEMVRMYEMASSRMMLSFLSGKLAKRKYFGISAELSSEMTTNIEQLSYQLKPLCATYPALPIHQRLLSQISGMADGAMKRCAEYRTLQILSQVQWKFSHMTTPPSIEIEFTHPTLSFPHLHAHQLLVSYCSSEPEREWSSERGLDIESKVDELNGSMREKLRIEQQAYYHNLSSYLLHHSNIERRTVEAVVLDGQLSPMMELALFIPQYGTEMKWSLTRMNPCPSLIEIDDSTRITTLRYNAEYDSSESEDSEGEDMLERKDIVVELKPFSVITVELTVDMRHYPEELFVRRILIDDIEDDFT